ncbi:MAG: Phosphoenolpyruvate synthase / pyruvate phosphate dikinase [Solirubrobacterales bacterium]|nr:Phosphoenolpyruvate synthase / pyruvate phosphate dikinase [Solirubrobacterales bacterium]
MPTGHEAEKTAAVGLPHVLELEACVGDEALARTGGKAVGLGRLLDAGLPVPRGFAVTTDAYRAALGDALGAIDELVGAGGTPAANEAASVKIRARIEALELPAAVADAIDDAYSALGDDVPVAVRSSATAEDTGEASFAGQQDTYLWVRGAHEVRRHVVRCWSSLFTPHAIGYRERVTYSADDLAMGVVVQEMVDAEAAGVALTLDPATGARDVVYLEAALGLGEGVVRGDVPGDRIWVAKDPPAVTRTEVATKDRAHRFDADAEEVRVTDVDADAAAAPALSDAEALAVAALASRIETIFERPMDIEWALAADREVALLQARPETVWSHRDAPAPPGQADDWDPLHHTSPPTAHWTTTNLGETAPGVLSPLAWTLWRTAGESAIRRAGHNLGVLDDSEVAVPTRDEDRLVKAFYGRAAMQVEFLATLGDRMPGTTGQEAVRSILGDPPEDIAYAPTRCRWPAVARKLPVVFTRGPGWLHAEAERTERWWQASVARVDGLDRDQATRLFAEAEENFSRTLALQTTGLLGVVQPLYDALGRLCAKTGVGDVNSLSAGYSGFKEVAVVGELWRAAHGQTTIEAIVAEHGFHGPLEGELSTRVWREDPSILEGLLHQYASREDPRVRDTALRARREQLEGELVASVAPPLRPAVRRLLAMCARRIPLRGVAKRSFLQSIDVARAAARQIGDCLVAEGVLADREDVFYLTTTELTGTLPANARELVARRRARREMYRALEIPASWTGDCVPVDPGVAHAGDPDIVTGIGVSAGVVEGVVRVLQSSSSRDLQPDEILVAGSTDPSWSSIMFISAALVVDIGGALSHASMVARELGIPCVVNTANGTRRLKTGDRVRVDGGRGLVEILGRASEPPDQPARAASK